MTIGEIGTIVAVVLSAVSMLLGGRRNTQTDAVAQGRLEGKVDAMARSVEDIRVDVRSLKNDISAHTAKIAELESRTKSAHERIDGLENLFHQAHPPT